MIFSSKPSGRALRLRTSSGGAVPFSSASPLASRAKDSPTSRPNTAGMKALNPTPLALIVGWLISMTSVIAAIIARSRRPWREAVSIDAGVLLVGFDCLIEYHLGGQPLVADF